MTSGFQAFTDSGVLVFDATYKVPSQVAKASVTASEMPMATNYVRFYTLTVTSAFVPIVALYKAKSATGKQGVTLLTTSRSGNVWTFKIVVVDTNFTDFTFSYYVFDAPSGSDGYGLEVFNEAGEMVFTSAAPVLRPVPSTQSGNAYAVMITSKMAYYEQVDWDSTLMREIYTTNYEINVCSFNGVNLISEIVNVDHQQGFQPPNLGYENFGFDQDPLLIKVTNQ